MPGVQKVTARDVPGGYSADIERLPGEVGKRVVVDGIEVGEIYRPAHRHHQHVRQEMPVLLQHLLVSGSGRPSRGSAGISHSTTPE